MLVISRRREESIVMDGGIRLVILDIKGDRVKVGIDAPKECRILREELEDHREKGAEG